MTDKPKPLTKAEWEAFCMGLTDKQEPEALRIVALVDALFAYRERTRGFFQVEYHSGTQGTHWTETTASADVVAAELGLE